MDKNKQLFNAIDCNYIARLKGLIKAGADVNITDSWGCTPLKRAIGSNRTECLRLLLDSGADVNAKDNWGKTALGHAVDCIRIQCLRLLLDSGADVNRNELCNAIGSNRVECLEMLIDSGADVNTNAWGNTLLHEAIGSSRPKCIRLLLKKGAIVDKSDFFHALDLNRMECFKALFESGVDVNVTDTSGRSLLQKVVNKNHSECVKLLIEAGADVNSRCNIGDHPVHSAAKKGNQSIMEMLLKAGADINAINRQGWTPIMCAAYFNRTGTVKFLLKNNAEIRTDFGVNMPDNTFVPKKQIDLTDAAMLFFAAGGKITFMYVKETPAIQYNLKHLGREAIRKHLLDLDPRQHLFRRIPLLPLPTRLKSYLLFDMSLEDTKETNEGTSENAIDYR